MGSRPVDIFCFEKTRLRENAIGMIKRKAVQYKLLWRGNYKSFERKGISMVEKWIHKVLDISW